MSESGSGSLDAANGSTSNIADINTNNNVKRLKRQLRVSGATVSDGMSTSSLSISKVNALRASLDKHQDAVAKILLASKDTLEKRTAIESGFRACKDAFVEVSLTLINLLEMREREVDLFHNINKVVKEAVDNINDKVKPVSAPFESIGSYATAVRSSNRKVVLPHGSQLEIPSETNFFVMPDKNQTNKFKSAQETKEVVCKVLKPSDCGLRINRISLARNNAIRISANSPDLERLKMHPGLKNAGLKIVERIKSSPRMILRGVPTGMSDSEIKEELILQNLGSVDDIDLKVIYIFPNKASRNVTSCILEVSPDVHRVLSGKDKLYLRYSVCTVADYVRVLQCFKCLSFGHFAKNCESQPKCGHCGGTHEMRDCKVREGQPRCGNVCGWIVLHLLVLLTLHWTSRIALFC